MSALPPKAYITAAQTNVRFVPIVDSCTAANGTSFDHLVGAFFRAISAFIFPGWRSKLEKRGKLVKFAGIKLD